MKTELHPKFKKSYKNRIASDTKLIRKVAERIKLFQKDPTNPLLKDHKLTGAKNHPRAFWVTGDIRIVYFLTSSNQALLLDIGSHNQVY